MEIFNLREVNGRNKRRKQAKDGRFNKKALGNATESLKDTENSSPQFSEEQIEKAKLEIREKLKKQNRFNFILYGIVFISVAILVYFLMM